MHNARTQRLISAATFALILVICALSATDAAAQTTQPVASPDSISGTSAALLAGPRVDDAALDDGGPLFGPGGQTRRQLTRLQPRQWLEVLRTLDLRADQKRPMRRLVMEFRTAQREFQREHGKEFRELRQSLQASREQGTRIDPQDLKALRELQEMMPSPLPTLREIWDMLDRQQQAEMREKLEQAREEQLDRRNERMSTMASEAEDRMREMMRDRTGDSSTGEDADSPAIDRRLQRLKRWREQQGPYAPGAPPTEADQRFHFDEDEAGMR